MWAALCLLLVAPWVARCYRAYAAAGAANRRDAASLQLAVKLEPDEPAYQFKLGEYLLIAGQDPTTALPYLETAVRLNAHAARYWLTLAQAQLVAGKLSAALQATDRAVALDPTTPTVLQEAGNLYLAEGSQDKALRAYNAARQMLGESDPTRQTEILRLSWRASGNVQQLLDAGVPASTGAYAEVLAFFCNEGDLDSAAAVWQRLLALRQRFDPAIGVAYAGKLIAAARIEQAEQVWSALSAVNAPFPYARPADNLIIDGGFEQPILNDGFGWRYQSQGDAVRVQIDPERYHSGSHSLLVRFSGNPAALVGLTQFVPVRPDASYRFSVWVKPDLQTASGLRWRIVDAAAARFAQTDDVQGTGDWQALNLDFTTGPQTRVVQLMAVRDPAQPLIRGQVWIDDLRLTER